jgi:hypothetical protein
MIYALLVALLVFLLMLVGISFGVLKGGDRKDHRS